MESLITPRSTLLQHIRKAKESRKKSFEGILGGTSKGIFEEISDEISRVLHNDIRLKFLRPIPGW